MKQTESKKPIELTVRQKHLEGATQKDCTNCVFARAACDLPGVAMARVNSTRTELIYGDGEVVSYSTPEVAKRAIEHWDKTNVWDLPLNTPISFGAIPPSKRKSAIRKRAKTIRTEIKQGLRPAPRTDYELTGRNTPSIRQTFARAKRRDLASV